MGILKHVTILMKDAHKATHISTFPFDYSSFFYIALKQYDVLLLVQKEQDKDSLRQTEDSCKTDTIWHLIDDHIK